MLCPVMSVEQRIEEGLRALRRSRRKRAWILVPALPSAMLALFVTGVVMRRAGGVESMPAIAWAAGLMCGAAALLYFGSVPQPSRTGRRVGIAALWTGNLAFSVLLTMAPASILGVALFIAGGAIAIRNTGAPLAALYACVPVIAAATAILLHEPVRPQILV